MKLTCSTFVGIDPQLVYAWKGPTSIKSTFNFQVKEPLFITRMELETLKDMALKSGQATAISVFEFLTNKQIVSSKTPERAADIAVNVSLEMPQPSIERLAETIVLSVLGRPDGSLFRQTSIKELIEWVANYLLNNSVFPSKEWKAKTDEPSEITVRTIRIE